MRRAALIAVSASVLASCGSRVRDDVWDELAAHDGVTVVTRAGGDGAASDDLPQVTATTAVRSRGGSEGRRGVSAGSSAEPGPLPAPAEGTYTWDETGGGAKRSTTERWTAQHQTNSVALTSVRKQEDEGDTITETTKYRVTRNAFELLSETSTYNDEEPETCSYKPAALVMPLPLKVGAKWKTNATCEGDEASEDEATEFEVTGSATDIIGGQQVKTFVVRGITSLDTTDETTGERTSYTFTDTRHVDPATLLVVIEDATVDFDGEKTSFHRQLRSLTPS